MEINLITSIVIDPAHGGKDSGTMGTKRFDIYEKHIALLVSLKLSEYITNQFPEVNIHFTRKKDVFLELYERTEIANKLNADLFISIDWADYRITSYEALAMGTKVILSDETDTDEFLIKSSYLYITSPTIKDTAECMKQALEDEPKVKINLAFL